MIILKDIYLTWQSVDIWCDTCSERHTMIITMNKFACVGNFENNLYLNNFWLISLDSNLPRRLASAN